MHISPEIISTLLESGRPFEITPDGGLIVDGKRSRANRSERNSRYYKRLKATESVLNATETSESSLPPPSPLSPSQVSPNPPSSSPPISPSLHLSAEAAPTPQRPQKAKLEPQPTESDGRFTAFKTCFEASFLEATAGKYPFHKHDAVQLSALLKKLPDLQVETFREALTWCRNTALSDPFAKGFVHQTGSLASFCTNWGQIAGYAATYQPPLPRRR